METLVSHIEHRLQGAKGPYYVARAPIYEHELKRFWPLNEEHRKAKIAQFAKKHGFRLRFYSKGLFAIFDKESPKRDTKVNDHDAGTPAFRTHPATGFG